MPNQRLSVSISKLRDYANAIPPLVSKLPVAEKRVAMVGCGATALGLQAAMNDAELDWPLLQGSHDWQALVAHRPDPEVLVGLSFSGNSVEVLDTLGLAKGNGCQTILISNASGIDPDSGIDHLIHPPGWDLGRRWLPLAASLLATSIAKSDDAWLDLPETPIDMALIGFLGECHRRRLLPIFTAQGDGFAGRALSSQWSEYLKRPSFFQLFPQWTHTLLWGLGPQDADRLAFIHLLPQAELSDRRFANTCGHLDRLGIAQIQSLLPPTSPGSPGSLRLLHWGLRLYDQLAEMLGIDPEQERSFG